MAPGAFPVQGRRMVCGSPAARMAGTTAAYPLRLIDAVFIRIEKDVSPEHGGKKQGRPCRAALETNRREWLRRKYARSKGTDAW